MRAAVGDAERDHGVVQGITAAIAGASQEQAAATREISANLQQVTAGNRTVIGGIGAIEGLCGETGQAAPVVITASGRLRRQAVATQAEVRRFSAGMRRA